MDKPVPTHQYLLKPRLCSGFLIFPIMFCTMISSKSPHQFQGLLVVRVSKTALFLMTLAVWGVLSVYPQFWLALPHSLFPNLVYTLNIPPSPSTLHTFLSLSLFALSLLPVAFFLNSAHCSIGTHSNLKHRNLKILAEFVHKTEKCTACLSESGLISLSIFPNYIHFPENFITCSA